MPPAQLWVGGIFFFQMAREQGEQIDGRLQIRNVALNTIEDELRALFGEVGEVLDVKIIRDRLSGDSRGYAFVTLSALSEADTAVSRLNNRELHGLRLMVSLAQARTVHGRSGEILPLSDGG